MEAVGLILLVGVIAWWYLAKQKQQREERKHELENWEYDASDETYDITYVVNFPTMRMVYRFRVMDLPSRDYPAVTYQLRRKDNGRWQSKMSHESFMQRLHELRDEAKKDTLMAKSTLEEFEGRGNKWTTVGDEMAPALEAAYQRYVRSG